jgi:hypothetical protein
MGLPKVWSCMVTKDGRVLRLQPPRAGDYPVNFAWTPGRGSYRHYPPYVNLTGGRLTVRGPEKLDGEHPQPGDIVAVELPPEVLAELRAALPPPPSEEQP